MRGRGDDRLDPVRKPRTENDAEPSAADSEQPRGQIAKPHSGGSVRGKVRAIDMQRQSGPDPPPLTAANEARVNLAHIEGIQPPQSIGNDEGNAGNDHRVDEASPASVRMKFRRF